MKTVIETTISPEVQAFSRQLIDFLAREKESQSAFARSIAVPISTLNDFLRAKRDTSGTNVLKMLVHMYCRGFDFDALLQELSKSLIEAQENNKMQGQHQFQSSMATVNPEDLPDLPSLIAGYLLQLTQEGEFDRDAIANMLQITRSRVDALIESKPHITEQEYAAIAELINQRLGGGWTAETLRETKEFWDRAAGKISSNGVS